VKHPKAGGAAICHAAPPVKVSFTVVYDAEYQHAYFIQNKERLREYRRTRYAEHKDEICAKRNAYHRRLRQQVLAGYGNRCACCGETNSGFLSLDHVNGGGRKHRQELGSAPMVWLAAIKAGFPAEYQVLCYNCNLGRQFNGGKCPHETEGC
jgi:hypothetical protein